MSPIQNFEQLARRLIELDVLVTAQLQMTMEVRDGLEIAHTSVYLNFLKCFFHAFSAILTSLTIPQLHLNQSVLVGTGQACFETLRPLAYSLLAEMVHHVQGDLSLAQVEPIFEKGVDQAAMDEARILLV